VRDQLLPGTLFHAGKADCRSRRGAAHDERIDRSYRLKPKAQVGRRGRAR
jgi:hypothetical protein